MDGGALRQDCTQLRATIPEDAKLTSAVGKISRPPVTDYAPPLRGLLRYEFHEDAEEIGAKRMQPQNSPSRFFSGPHTQKYP